MHDKSLCSMGTTNHYAKWAFRERVRERERDRDRERERERERESLQSAYKTHTQTT